MSEKKTVGEGSLLGFTVDSGWYLIEKGSVAVDGVSLTVNKVIDNAFRVMIIPQTSIWTGLTQKNVNDKVNIEFDLIGKYIEKFVSSSAGRTSVTEETLLRHGFI
jgi:riboflavin synthase